VSFKEDFLKKLNYTGQYEVVAGSEKDKRVCEALRGALEEEGVDAQLIPLPCMSWRAKVAFVEVEGLKIRAEPLPYTPSGDIEARAVFINTGLHESEWKNVEAEDKVVLLEWFKDNLDDVNWQYINAVLRGARAVVLFDPYPGRFRRIVITAERDYRYWPGAPPPIPALSIRREDGLKLIKKAREGRSFRVYSKTEVRHGATTYIIESKGEGVLVTAHYDRWFEGFTDDRAGLALLLLLCERLKDEVGYVIFGAEESGAPGYSPWYWTWGSRSYVSMLRSEDRLKEVMAVINLDVLGSYPLHISISSPDFLEAAKRVLGNVVKYSLDLPIFDSFSFSREGVPAATLHSMESLLKVYHTSADTLALANWHALENSYKVALKLIEAFLREGKRFLRYEALKGYLEGELSELTTELSEAEEVIDVVKTCELNEETARALRKVMFSAVYEGRYEDTFNPFSTHLLPCLLIKGDLKRIKEAKNLLRRGEFEQALRVLLKVPNYRVAPGEERVLPYLNLKDVLRAVKDLRELQRLLEESEEAARWSLILCVRSLKSALKGAVRGLGEGDYT